MTLPTSAATDRRRPAVRRVRRGFTLVELLVVIGIMALLIGLLSPMVMKAWQSANRTKLAGDLQAIASALEARKADFGDYPRVVIPAATRKPYDGAIVLCQSLVGPGDPDDLDSDAAPAAGFRRRPGGKMLPPYLAGDRFRMKEVDGTTDDPTLFVLLDHYDKPILYFPASPAKPNVREPGGTPLPYVDARDGSPSSETSRYDANDNLLPFDADATIALTKIRLVLGDNNNNGYIDGSEQPVDLPFLLWSAGADDLYGPTPELASPDAVLDEKDVPPCDDVTNFRS